MTSKVYPLSYEKDAYQMSALEAEGICFRFSEWLKAEGMWDESPMDIYNNTSGIRDGNRLDIHNEYRLDNGNWISYLYTNGSCVYAVIYNDIKKAFVGEIEIPCA